MYNHKWTEDVITSVGIPVEKSATGETRKPHDSLNIETVRG